MAEYLSPGVYVEEVPPISQTLEGVGTSTAGFIGMAEKGAVEGTPLYIGSFTDFRRSFGGYLLESTHGRNRFLAYAVEQFFANGGSRCYVMRVAPEDAKSASAAMSSLVVTARNPGAWGNGVKVTAVPAYKSKTTILGTTEDAATSTQLYTLKNAGAFQAGDVVALVRRGKIETYNRIVKIQGAQVTFENAFEGDVVAKNLIPEVVLQSCEVSIEVVSGEDVEAYEFVSFNPASQDYIENRMARSNLVWIQYNQINEILPPMLAISGNAESTKEVFTLSGGSDGSVKDAPDSVFIGADNGPGRRTGLEAFQEITNVSLMAIPGVTTPAVQLALVTHCKNLASRFAVLDVPLEITKPQDILAFREVIDSDYAAMYHPWPQIYDMQTRKPTFVPPSGAVLGIFARSDTARGVHKAPANEIVNNCLGLSCLYSKAEQDLLNPRGVNLIRALPGQGIRVWGARTCSSDNLWKYVNVRRLFISIEETIKTQTNSFVFEPNDQLLWLRVRSTIVNYLRGLYRAGALVGGSEDEAFFVRVGRDTMTRDDILGGRLIVELGVAPSRPAEFVIFRITQKMEQDA